jgi:rhamnogalacturonyl hydrolase YesR
MKSVIINKSIFRGRITWMKFLVLIIISASSLNAQNLSKDEVLNTVKKIADNAVKEATYLYYDNATGNLINDIQSYGYNKYVVPQSEFNRWHYAVGVVHVAFNYLAQVMEEEKYKNFTRKNFEFFFEDLEYFKSIYNGENVWNFPLGQAIVVEELDHCGSMGASLIELYNTDKKKEYKTYIDRAADHIMNRQMRLDDGTFSRSFPEYNTVWADDLYMSVPFLARMGKLSGENKYFDEAVKQVFLFNNLLYIPEKQIMRHCYYGDIDAVGGHFWGRCNGWMMVATADLLRFLPEDHPKRADVISILNRNIRGVAQYQSPSGLWHQLLDKNDSYLETSCTAMFTYSIAMAVNNGWVDDRYNSIALNGWKGLLTNITAEGTVRNICRGTSISEDVDYYYSRAVIENDTHGVGITILAGVEISKLLE